jgi:hypothetical protein
MNSALTQDYEQQMRKRLSQINGLLTKRAAQEVLPLCRDLIPYSTYTTQLRIADHQDGGTMHFTLPAE